METSNKDCILFIDNNQECLVYSAEHLSNKGYQVLRASTGNQGLEWISSYKPAVVVIADMLPDMEALQVCSKIKSRADVCPPWIVLYSALSRSSEERAQGLEAGAAAYVQEPLQAREIVAQILSLLQIREEDTRLEAQKCGQELNKAQVNLARNQQLLLDITSNLPGAIIQFAAQKGELPKPIYVSQGIKELMQLDPQEVQQDAKLLWANLHPEDAIQVHDRLFTSLEEGQPFETEFRIITEDHSVKWLRLSTVPYIQDHKKVLYAILIDITWNKLENREGTPKNLYDSLTDLPSYQLFMDRLQQSLCLAQRYGYKVGLIFLDLDDLKSINTQYGRPVGDKLLHQTGQRLLGSMRSSDTVARYGDDKFVVIANQVNDSTCLERVAGKVCMSMEDPFLLAGHFIQMEVNLGLSMYPDEADNAEDLILKSIQDMYQAKSRLGGNSEDRGRRSDVGGRMSED